MSKLDEVIKLIYDRSCECKTFTKNDIFYLAYLLNSENETNVKDVLFVEDENYFDFLAAYDFVNECILFNFHNTGILINNMLKNKHDKKQKCLSSNTAIVFSLLHEFEHIKHFKVCEEKSLTFESKFIKLAYSYIVPGEPKAIFGTITKLKEFLTTQQLYEIIEETPYEIAPSELLADFDSLKLLINLLKQETMFISQLKQLQRYFGNIISKRYQIARKYYNTCPFEAYFSNIDLNIVRKIIPYDEQLLKSLSFEQKVRYGFPVEEENLKEKVRSLVL